MKCASLIRKKYSFNNIQILSKYELQSKYESVLSLIKPNDILQDLSFFKDIIIYFDSTNSDKAFLTYKFTLYCYLLLKGQEHKLFQKIFLKYSKIFIKACHKFYPFIIIKIAINDEFDSKNKNISVNEFNKLVNKMIEDYKENPYDNILEININNFFKNDLNKSFFLILIESFKYPFSKEQIKAISKYIVDNSEIIIEKILDSKESKISFFKKINNIIQFHIKEIPNIIINNTSKKKCLIYIEEFFISIITIYELIIKLFQQGFYDFYEKNFMMSYIQKNLITTIMQFLEKKYFSITDTIISKITKLFDSIESFLIKNLKLEEKDYFIEYSWIMAQFFDFLYHGENKTQSIIYGNKIINLYKNKTFISRAIIFIKLSLYEYYLKNQKENISEYDLDEHINNISELITMFGKCEIENKNSEKYLKKMLNHLFKILTEHIIYIINNRPRQVKDIYKLLNTINPFIINCANNSKNKSIVKTDNYFCIYYSLTSLISFSPKNKDDDEYKKILKYFIGDNNLTEEEKTLFINIISFFTVYGKNNQDKIFQILKDLFETSESEQFLDIYFNILYQLEKIENYNSGLLFSLLNILITFLEKKYDKDEITNDKFYNNYFPVYTVYIFNSIKYNYTSILKLNKEENSQEKNANKSKIKDCSDNFNEDGILIKISSCLKFLNKFSEIHAKILTLLFIKEKEGEETILPYNKSIYYIHNILYLNFFLELTNYTMPNNNSIFQQIYLISTNENIFNNLPSYIQNFIYYILYRLIHNINSIIDNRDLFLIKGKSEISKNIKSIIYNNIVLMNDFRKKNKQIKNDSFFSLEPLISTIIDNEKSNEDLIFDDILKKDISFDINFKQNIGKYINFKINFISDVNILIELIKLHYITGEKINSNYLQSFFDYYIPILKTQKEFSSNFSLILNLFYLIKNIFLPDNNTNNEKINFTIICTNLKIQSNNQITKKNIIIRLLVKYIYIKKGQNENKKKLNDVLSLLMNELNELKKDKNLINNEQKTQRYLTYIELLSLEYFINIYNGKISENNIDELLNKGRNILIKCLELLKAFLNEKYIRQYYPNERNRLKAINDFLFYDISQDDALYLLNMDDYEFIFLLLLNKVYVLSEFLFNKMFSYGYGDSIIELFHKFRSLTIIKYNKIYCEKFFCLLIKVMRKWKRKEKYDISVDIGDFKNNEEYDNFIKLLFFGYTKSKYYSHNWNKYNNLNKFDINEFVKENKIEDDLLLNKCLELDNINSNFTVKETSIFLKNLIKNLKMKNNFVLNNVEKLKNIFLKKFNITSASSYYFANFLNIDKKYIIKIIPLLFEDEIIDNILLNEQTFQTIIDLYKTSYKSYNINNWREYKYIKYCKKNIKHLIYISSSSNKISEQITIKLINLYISYFHNFKYNLSYKGNESNQSLIDEIKNEEIKSKYNIDFIEKINKTNIEIDTNEIKMDLDIKEKNECNIIGIEEDKYKNINLISMFRINNYIFLYIKLKEKISYDKINIDKEKDFELFLKNIKEIAANENSEQKIKKKIKNDEYRKALFTFQNILIKYFPNFINSIRKYYESHTSFINYINTKINKYSLKITPKDIIKWMFEITDIQIKNKNRSHYNTSKRFKLMSIDDYKKKFIKKIFYSHKFKFSFYEENINDLFYYIPSIELSKIPLENIPLLYNLAIVRTLNINYIKPNPIHKIISITKDIFCLLNPKSDLVDTEKKILPILKEYNIKCMNSKEPSEKDMEQIISNKLMYIYCGHGSSLKYLRKEYIESHKINFLTFLFGCSSASSRLLSEKDTQPLSTPQLFLKQLCPFFFGFLWPVSSSDLDELTVDLIETLLKKKGTNSLIKIIIILKRKFCLRWFNGGALVIYCNSDVLPEFDN